MRPLWARVWVLLLLVSSSVACKDEAKVKVSSLSLQGVQVVDEAQLRAALQTKAGSWIPFTKKPAFDTDEFQRDLQRLRSFYTERGYPDARVTDVDVVFDEKKEHVRLTVTVREGEPTLVASMRFEGFEVLLRAPAGVAALAAGPGVRRRARSPPRRRGPQHGPERPAGIRLSLRQGRRRRAACRGDAGRGHRRPCHARPGGHLRPDRGARPRLGGRGRHPAPAGLQARRALQRRPGPGEPEPPVVARSVPLRLRRAPRRGHAAVRRADAHHGRRGQAPAVHRRGRLRHRGEGPRARRVEARQLPGRRPQRRHRGQVLVARSRRPGELQRTVVLHPPPRVLGVGTDLG